MKKNYSLSKVLLLDIAIGIVFNCSNAFTQEHKFVAGMGIDFFKDQSYAWVEEPYNHWVDLYPSTAFNLYCHYKTSPYFQFGAYTEFLTMRLDRFSLDEEVIRCNLGISCIGKYPDWYLHWQMGAYFAPGIILPDEHENNAIGLDYGMIAGPALEIKQFGVAFHFHSGYARYVSGGEPEKLRYYNPRFFLKTYYTF